MNWLAEPLTRQVLLAGLVVAAVAALVLRSRRPSERRSLRLALVLMVFAAVALLVAALPGTDPGVQVTAAGVAFVLGGLAAIQVASALLFRVLLPLAGMAVPRIAHDLAGAILSIAWVVVWLRLAGVNPAQLFTTSAVVTAVLAFSMQDTLGNVLGGIVIQLDNSLRVGDWVRIDDVNGRVVDVRWRYTTIETRSRELVIVPNSWLMKNRFYILRPPEGGTPAYRRGVVLQVEAQADPHAVIQALERSVADAEIANVLSDPPPSAILSEVGAGFARYTLRFWMADPQHDDPADSAVRIHALMALARAGVRLGLPQEERLTIKEDESWREAQRTRDARRRLDAIRQTDLFARLPAAEQEALAERLVHAPFAPGDVMTRQGAVAHWLYLIIRGEANVYVDTPQGRLEVAVLTPGSVFGEMGMLTGEARSATVVAKTSVDCYRLDKVGFAEVLRARPDIAQEMSAIVEARMAVRNARLAEAGSSPVTQGDLLQRIVKFFSLRA